MRIAVVPGDGIGPEVVSSTLTVLGPLRDRLGLDVEHDVFGWGADEWLATGVGLPPGALDRLARDYDAVLLGALGDPRIPDMAHGRAILLGLRRGLDLYVNHRPIELPGHTVDLYRENTQDLYAGVGGVLTRFGSVTAAVDECVHTRDVVERFTRFALARLRAAGRTRVTLVHKANAVPNSGKLWLDVFRAELEAFPDLDANDEYVDSFCYHLVRDPSRYEGVVTSNMFGDIISDIGAALMGGLGLAASANLCPETGFGLFEPVHGSAPDIAGTGVANPCAAVKSLAMLFDHAGHAEAATLLRAAVRSVAAGDAATPDLGGRGTTGGFMAAVTSLLADEDFAGSMSEGGARR